MKLVGLMPVRNEAWVLGLSARVALMWCDALEIRLHACTDDSLEIAYQVWREHPGRVSFILDPVSRWDEMVHRQRLLESARKAGATHFALIDADEVLTGNLASQSSLFRGAIHAVKDGFMVELPGYNLRGGIASYHADGVWGRRWFATAFKDADDLGWSGDKFHSREPGPRKLTPYRPIAHGAGGVMHLWGASERRLRAKHALYKITERLRWPEKQVVDIDRMYSWAIYGGEPYETADKWTYNPVPESWWAPYAHLMKYLDVEAEPWQEAECQRLVVEHGREKFSGLDLFGVA